MLITTISYTRANLRDTCIFTPLFDLHLDFNGTNVQKVLDICQERKGQYDHCWCGIFGDLMDWILPGDRRYVASNAITSLSTHTAYINYCIDFLVEYLTELKPGIIGIGNHELTLLHRTGFNVVFMLCERLGIPYGSYEGRLRFRSVRSDGCGVEYVNMLYHHGAWGGRVDKGFSGARDYARKFADWDVFLYGHNHQRRCDVEDKDYILSNKSHKQAETYLKQSLYVNCGTARGTDRTKPVDGVDYSIKGGLTRSSISCPQIIWHLQSDNGIINPFFEAIMR